MIPDRNIRYIDFHTHKSGSGGDIITILNLMAGEDIPSGFPDNTLFSAGIHPWQLTADNLAELKTKLILTAAHPHVVLIGEAGFDRLRGAPSEIQYQAFAYQAEIAAEMEKPMVIHCVRGWEDLRRAYRHMKPVRPWIIHGFRGKGRLAASLADEGFWFSVGKEGITDEILGAVSNDRILLETDISDESIAEVYTYYAEATGCDEEEAVSIIKRNFNNLFNYSV
jgi:TatD DNase family protein